jgi:hypothetical protein
MVVGGRPIASRKFESEVWPANPDVYPDKRYEFENFAHNEGT